MDEELGWLSSTEALASLKVRRQTLYAYVSRGRIQTKPDRDNPRRKLYSLPDVERLASMSRNLRRPSAVAASAIAWGEPVLSSGVSTVHRGRLVYRGLDAVELLETATLEEAARILWQLPADPFAGIMMPTLAGKKGDGIARALNALGHHAAGAASPIGRQPSDLGRDLVTIVHILAASCSPKRGRTSEPVHAFLARCWNAPQAADTIRRALVLLADHELNVSTFAVRVTASTGAALSACVLSGLCALTGPLHCLAARDVQALVGSHDDNHDALPSALGHLPGFGHPLYAGMDARAAALLDSFAEPDRHARLRARVASEHGLAPNIDYALSALTKHFQLPEDASLMIFAVARSVGWLAHALEQVQQGELIRPRAKYNGPRPA